MAVIVKYYMCIVSHFGIVGYVGTVVDVSIVQRLMFAPAMLAKTMFARP